VDTGAAADYPLGTRRPDSVTTPAGRPLAELTLDALRAGEVDRSELRAAPETLLRQAGVARTAGRPQLGESLERAAELARVPPDVILDVYSALRPRRSTHETLEGWAGRLEAEWNAPLCAAFVREAAAVYERRGLLDLGDEQAGEAL